MPYPVLCGRCAFSWYPRDSMDTKCDNCGYKPGSQSRRNAEDTSYRASSSNYGPWGSSSSSSRPGVGRSNSTKYPASSGRRDGPSVKRSKSTSQKSYRPSDETTNGNIREQFNRHFKDYQGSTRTYNSADTGYTDSSSYDADSRYYNTSGGSHTNGSSYYDPWYYGDPHAKQQRRPPGGSYPNPPYGPGQYGQYADPRAYQEGPCSGGACPRPQKPRIVGYAYTLDPDGELLDRGPAFTRSDIVEIEKEKKRAQQYRKYL